jgi:hypothetical protein
MRQAQQLAAEGRGGDTEIAHVARGELVIPRQLQNPDVLAALTRAAAAHNIPLEMLSIGNPMNRINPETGMPEFGFGDWLSGLFGGDENNDAQAIAEGAAARTAHTGIKSDLTRGVYEEHVSQLDPYDNAGREHLKTEFRQQTPPEVRAFIKDKPLGPGEGSIGRANVTNPMATEAARSLGRIGRGAGLLGTGLAAADIATSDNPYRAAVANAGSLGGGILGGAGGAMAGGLLTGP